MNETIDNILSTLEANGNLRAIPREVNDSRVDFSSNDYLGLADDLDLRREFMASLDVDGFEMSASASRLLARKQNRFTAFEDTLSEAYGHGRKALVFNSGYHANTGLISAFAGTKGHIIADKLVHASIIDGIKLSGLPFDRFRHNDTAHLDRLATKAVAAGHTPIIIAESIYSMDGDSAPLADLAEIKKRYPGALLYIDEAHGVGVAGNAGLGLCTADGTFEHVDIMVGTLGKALASTGAYAIVSPRLRSFMVNKARSLIFSTAIPPLSVEWSRFIFTRMLGMDSRRERLRRLATRLSEELSSIGAHTLPSHIQPVVVGNPTKAVALSRSLAAAGYEVLPIRTPTVPPGTDRLRLSLSAAITPEQIKGLGNALRASFSSTDNISAQ